MGEKERWERIRKWAEAGEPKPEGYVPAWAQKVRPLAAPKPAEKDPPKSKAKTKPAPKSGLGDQEEFDRIMDQGDDPSDRGVS